MIDNLKSTLVVLQKINLYKDQKIYSNGDIEEANENIHEFKLLNEKLHLILSQLDNIECKDTDEVIKELISLHLVFSDFVWHYDQMHEMIKEMIAKFRD